MQLSPHGKGRGPSFEGTWNPSTQGCFVPSLVEIGPLVLEKNMKMLKVTTLTPTDNRQILIRKAHSGELIKLIHNSYQFQQFWVIFFIIARLFIFLKFKRYHWCIWQLVSLQIESKHTHDCIIKYAWLLAKSMD